VPSTFFGLPVHPLIVHAVVVLVPLAALLLGASAVSPRFRRWARYASPATALVGLVMVPLATSSGENLERTVQETALLREHTELGDTLLPFMIGVSVLASALAWFELRGSRGGAPSTGTATGTAARLGSPAVLRAVAVLGVVAALGTLVQVGRIGHSGAKSVWSQTSTSGGESDQGAPAR
jgi:hypothetical protein